MASLNVHGPRWLVFLAAALAGCTAVITDPGSSNSDASGPGSGSGSGSTPGSGAGPDSGGSTGLTPEGLPTEPGAPVVRRLNRAEYNNTVRDLLGTSLTPADDFPADDLGGEFTTVGSALSLSPAYVRAYEAAAHALIAELFAGSAERLAKVVSCDVESGGDACAQSVLAAFARRAWRRPVTDAELQALLGPLEVARQHDAAPTEGLKHSLATVLLSPHFIFKLEIDPNPAGTEPRRLTSHELATRLSYALWSTMPDDTLAMAADANAIVSDEQVSAQIQRMLGDARAEALLDGFAAQWLEIDHLTDHEVEASVFPGYSEELAAAMQREAKLFINEFLKGSQPVRELFTARFTFVNDLLAEHYALPTPAGGEMTRVDTTGTPRAGILTLGAFLTTTSFASRTSPVKRGEFVFSRLLCGTVDPPPPDVPSLPPEMPGMTLRERMELHRENPACAGCHAVMDPLGFGLENYDAVGTYRTSEGDEAIDASGTLPDGAEFSGAVELGGILASDPRTTACVTRKFMTFALGRLLNLPQDDTWVERLTADAEAEGGSLRSVIQAVLSSEAFRSRRPSVVAP